MRSADTIDPNTTLTFALSGATDDLKGVILWNHTEATGETYRGFKSVTASFSTDGVNFSGSEVLTFAEGPSTGTNGEYTVPGQLVSFGSTYDGITHVRFSDITKFIDRATSGDGADLYRMSELRFVHGDGSGGSVDPANLSIANDSGDLTITVTDMTPAATSKLQGNDDLANTNAWLDVPGYTSTGTATTNWTVSVSETNQFFRVISE